MIEQHGTGKNKFFTNTDYWDCECEKDYIHHKKTFGKVCKKCGATEDEMPDSRVNEIQR